MGKASRTTKLLLDLSKRSQGGANRDKRAALEQTVRHLYAARAFYVAFFLAYASKVTERVPFFSEHYQDVRERLISADTLLTWAEFQTVETAAHPHPLPAWNFSQAFPDFPFVYRRSVIKDAIGRVRAYLSNLAQWQHAGTKRGKPGLPGSGNHPVRYSRYFEQRRTQHGWEQQSPKLVLRHQAAELHVPQTKDIQAKKVVESKRDPDLVTVAVDLNVKQLAVITARQHGKIIQTRFVSDHGLDQHRYRLLRRVAKKQWQSGKPVKGEWSNQQLWAHIRRLNLDSAHKTARAIVEVCEQYPGCVLVFERLRKIKPQGGGACRRLNRKQANQLKGKINQLAKEKAYASGVVSVEVNPHGTSQYCARCGAKGLRFSLLAGQRVLGKGGKLFYCPVCHYECHADFNASCNVHNSFFRELHWQPRLKRSG